LAGGVITIGDGDFPDYRATNNDARTVFNLTNDQTAQSRHPTNVGQFPYYTIPGATGTNTNNSGNSGTQGFVPQIAANANQRIWNLSTTVRRYFVPGPFSVMHRRSGFGSYESGGNILDQASTGSNFNTRLLNQTVIPLTPSNGPLRTGSFANNGLYATAGINNGAQLNNPSLGCMRTGNVGAAPAATTNAFAAPNMPLRNHGQRVLPAGAGTTIATSATARFPFGYWCPTVAGSHQRAWNWGGGGNPSTDATAWFVQATQNAAAHNNTGMATGWLGGVLGWRPILNNAPSSGFTQLGDLSQTRLMKLMTLATMETQLDRNPDQAGSQEFGPLRTDGIFYSSHAIFALARAYENTFQNAQSATQGRWVHNGSVIAGDLGFLVTGDYTSATGGTNQAYTITRNTPFDFSGSTTTTNTGPGMGIFYDDRLQGFLGIADSSRVRLQRVGNYTQGTR
jgi:hypothetical protein